MESSNGVIEINEREIVERVFDLDTKQASDVMTPRTEITWLDESG